MKTAPDSPPRNILLIQLGDIGDVVLTTPTMRAIKECHPAARLSILVFKPCGNLLAADPHLHEVIETSRVRGPLLRRLREYAAFVRNLRQKHYDLAIDLRTGDRGALLSFLSGAKSRIGCRGIREQFWHDMLFTQVIRDLKVAPPPVHPGADQSLRVVRELGIDTENSSPKLYVAPSDLVRAKEMLAEAGASPEAGMITINPYSRWKYKEWSDEKWVQVIAKLWEAYRMPAVLVGSPEEAVGCQKIVESSKGHAINLAGKTTLGELAAAVSLSRLHLGVDSAASHIAAALGTATITIHGPTDWRGWRIVNEQHRIVSPEMGCVPCNMMGCDGSGESRCLDELNAEPVADTALDILGVISAST